MKYVRAFENFDVPWVEVVENNIDFKFIQTIKDLFTSESEEDYDLEISVYSTHEERYSGGLPSGRKEFKPIYIDDDTEESDVVWASSEKEKEMKEEIRKGNVWYRINFKVIDQNVSGVDITKERERSRLRKECEIFDNVIDRLSNIYTFKMTNHPSIDNINDIFGEKGFKTYKRDCLFLKLNQ